MLPNASMKRVFQNTGWIFLQGLVCLAAVLFLAGALAAQRDRPPEQASSPILRQAISEAATKYKIPGIAAALIEHGQLRAVEVFGVRDLKSNAPVTANTIFEAGPLGEPLYAYAVLVLSADGRFNPGAPLTNYLPLPYVRNLDATSASMTEPINDPRFNQITAIRVMNHTSGLPDWARNQHLRLQLPPGQKWLYSNEGYLYLQRVVEHITDEPLDAFMTRSILGPVGMMRSSFVWRDAYAADVATGYDKSGAAVEIHRYAHPAAAATLYTSIREYARFVTYLLASSPTQHAHESAVSLMLKPSVSVGDVVPISWGLGVGLENTDDDLFFFQRENGPGFQALVIASRSSGNGVIIFTNSERGLDAASDIVAAAIGGNHPVLHSTFLHAK
jgi:CubicO group peptidase (beta-lactamase class C family)